MIQPHMSHSHFCSIVLITCVTSNAIWEKTARGMNARCQGSLMTILEASKHTLFSRPYLHISKNFFYFFPACSCKIGVVVAVQGIQNSRLGLPQFRRSPFPLYFVHLSSLPTSTLFLAPTFFFHKCLFEQKMFLGISENAADQKGLLRQELLGEGSFPELQ